MSKKIVLGAELPDEVSAFFCANKAQVLTDVKIDVIFNLNQLPQQKEDDKEKIARLTHLLDDMQDNNYHPNRLMPQKRTKSMVVLLCLNIFIHLWKLNGYTITQYNELRKADIARLIAYITGIDFNYIEDLVPSKKENHRVIVPSQQQLQQLQLLLNKISNIDIKNSNELLR